MSVSKTPVKDSLVVFTEGARVNFKMWGNVSPIFGANIDGEPKLISVVFQKPEDKEAFRQRILGLIASGRLKEFVFVAECWLADADPQAAMEHLRQHGSLETFPGRREAVQVLYSSPDEEICYTASINRGSMGVVTLGEWEETRRSGRFMLLDLSTRFQGLFAQGKAGSN